MSRPRDKLCDGRVYTCHHDEHHQRHFARQLQASLGDLSFLRMTTCCQQSATVSDMELFVPS